MHNLEGLYGDRIYSRLTSVDNKRCPICGRRYKDILKHFVVVHNIKDMDQLNQACNEAKKKEEVIEAFSNYVEELKRKLKNGEISPEDYRELMMKWSKEHCQQNGEVRENKN